MTKLQRKAKGERPAFFADPNVDKVIAMVMGLAGEVAVMHDRMDTLERLLAKKAGIKRRDIENYKPGKKVLEARAVARAIPVRGVAHRGGRKRSARAR